MSLVPIKLIKSGVLHNIMNSKPIQHKNKIHRYSFYYCEKIVVSSSSLETLINLGGRKIDGCYLFSCFLNLNDAIINKSNIPKSTWNGFLETEVGSVHFKQASKTHFRLY